MVSMAMADWHKAITALTEAITLDPNNKEVVSSFAYVAWQVHHLNSTNEEVVSSFAYLVVQMHHLDSASPTLAKHKWLY